MSTPTPSDDEGARFAWLRLYEMEQRVLLGLHEQWGAAVSVAMEELQGRGLMNLNGSLTPLGERTRAYGRTQEPK